MKIKYAETKSRDLRVNTIESRGKRQDKNSLKGYALERPRHEKGRNQCRVGSVLDLFDDHPVLGLSLHRGHESVRTVTHIIHRFRRVSVGHRSDTERHRVPPGFHRFKGSRMQTYQDLKSRLLIRVRQKQSDRNLLFAACADIARPSVQCAAVSSS